MKQPYAPRPADRLALYRKKASESKHPAFKDWRKCRFYAKPAALRKNPIHSNGEAWLPDSLDAFPCRTWWDASEKFGMDHNGWYTDHWCQDTLIPCVVEIRLRRRTYIDDDNYGYPTHVHYFAAARHSDWDGAWVWQERYESRREAAYAADRRCERMAEDEREYQAQAQAEMDIDGLLQEAKDLRAEIVAIVRELRDNPGTVPPLSCALLQQSLRGLYWDRKHKFKRVAKLRDNFWLAVENCY